MKKRNVSRYTLNPAQIAIFPEKPHENTRAISINGELPPAPGTGVMCESVGSNGTASSHGSAAEELFRVVPTLYCAQCGGRGVQYQAESDGIDELPCQHCGGKGVITQGCHPGRNPHASIINQRLQTAEANAVDSPHQWVFPSPVYANCIKCKLTALTVRQPDPIDLMTP